MKPTPTTKQELFDPFYICMAILMFLVYLANKLI